MKPNLEMWTVIVAALLPLLIAVVQKQKWAASLKIVVTFLACLAASVGDVVFNPAIDLSDLPGVILTVVFVCVTAYSVFWRPTGIAPKIEKNINP